MGRGFKREPRENHPKSHVNTHLGGKKTQKTNGMNGMTHRKEISPPEDTSPATVGPQLLKMIWKGNTH